MGCGEEETSSVSISFDANTVVSGFVGVVDDD